MVHQNDYPWTEKASIVWKNKTTAASANTNTDNKSKNNKNNNKIIQDYRPSLTFHNDSIFYIFSHASNKNLLMPYYVPSTVLSLG